MRVPREAAEAGRTHIDEAKVERLQGLLDSLVSRKRIGHVVMGVAPGDRSWSWAGASGVAGPDGRPMLPDTPWFVASVTKLFISAAVLRLVEEGSVGLDGSITRYLPAEVTAGLHRIGEVDHTPRVTVRHLLSHTSGLPDFLEDKRNGGPSMYREMARGVDASWTFDDVVRIARDEMTPRFEPQDLDAPSQKARYSDTGFQLLIAIVEAVTGKSFDEALREWFFEPLGMEQTWLPGGAGPLEPAGEPASVYRKDVALDIPRALDSCNDLMGTTDDMLTFMRALARGEVFHDPGTYQIMQERWNRIGYPLRYGLGMMHYRIPRLWGPGRAVTLVGHSGGTGSWLFHCPELDLLLTGTVDQVKGRTMPYRLMPRVLKIAAG